MNPEEDEGRANLAKDVLLRLLASFDFSIVPQERKAEMIEAITGDAVSLADALILKLRTLALR